MPYQEVQEMSRKRRTFGAAFKAKVALAARRVEVLYDLAKGIEAFDG